MAVEVRPSSLHGRGLFSVQPLEPLTPVAFYGGRPKQAHEVMRRSKPQQGGGEQLPQGQREGELPTRTVIAKLRYLINSYDDAWVLDPTG